MQPNSNEDILFRDCQWGECLEYLYNIVHHIDNILLIKGGVDSGKTTLKKELINILSDNYRISSLSGNLKLSPPSFIKQIIVEVGLLANYDDTTISFWEELQQAVFAQPEKFNRILLIDDAEKLAAESFQLLVNLHNIINNAGGKLTLILFADLNFHEGINNSLLTDLLKENKLQIVELQPLNLAQMTTFLNEQMNLTFNSSDLKRIYNASEGIIGKVKKLALSELNIKQHTEEKFGIFNSIISFFDNITSSLFSRFIVCFGLLLLAYIAFNFQVQINSNKNINNKVEPVVAINTPLDLRTHSTEDFYNKNILEDHLAMINNLKEQFQIMNKEIAKLQEQVLALSSANKSLQLVNKKIAMAKDEIKAGQISKKALNPKILKINNLSNSYSLGNLNKDEQQLLGIDKNFYAFQIMASKNEQAIKNLINKYSSKLSGNKIKYFATKFKPKQDLWYIAVYGSYPNKELALKDLSNLSPDLKKLNPMLKNYFTIHRLIHNKED